MSSSDSSHLGPSSRHESGVGERPALRSGQSGGQRSGEPQPIPGAAPIDVEAVSPHTQAGAGAAQRESASVGGGLGSATRTDAGGPGHAATGAEGVAVEDLAQLLQQMIDLGASDLHITNGVPPKIRVDGTLRAMDYAPLDDRATQALLYSVMTDDQKAKLEGDLEVDFSFGIKDLARFRANVFTQRGVVAGALRVIPWRIPSCEDLGLPEVVEDICEQPRGLVLVTGPTGSGKSTTLAAMVDRINATKQHHIITIEDPIEYLHTHKESIINQRELHADTHSFAAAMRSALREDPDCVLIGEMRDLESTELSLKLAETGHLTLATLHTNSAVQTINRIINIFPQAQQSQIRTQLSFVLVAVISQALLPHASGKGRVLVQEILIPNAAIRNLIRESKIHQIYSSMQSGQAEHGMKTFNQDLARLVIEGKIEPEVALNTTGDKAELSTMLERLEQAARGRTRMDREVAERTGIKRMQERGQEDGRDRRRRRAAGGRR